MAHPLGKPVPVHDPTALQRQPRTELFGGALSVQLPASFTLDASQVRQVPDHQEVRLEEDPSTSIHSGRRGDGGGNEGARDGLEGKAGTGGLMSVVVEILERVEEVDDEAALVAHLVDMVGEDGDEGSGLRVWGDVQKVSVGEGMGSDTPAYTLLATVPTPARQDYRQQLGHTGHHNTNQLAHANNTDNTAILLTLIRLKAQATDLLVSINVPGLRIDADGRDDIGEVDLEAGKLGRRLERAVKAKEMVVGSLQVKDWGLFGGRAGGGSEGR